MINYFKKRDGQVMFLTVVVLGAVISSVTVIAGVLMSFQIRRSADVAASTEAIFAADAGVECMLYEIFGRGVDTTIQQKVDSCNAQGGLGFSNQSSYEISTTGEIVPGVPNSYKSTGDSSNSVRSIDIDLNLR